MPIKLLRHFRARQIAIGLLFVTLILLVSWLPVVSSLKASAQQLKPNSWLLPPGGSVRINIRGFCLEFGKPFSTGEMTVLGMASDDLGAALNYSILMDYVNSQPRQVQQALWYLGEGTWRAERRVVAEEIVANAGAASLPAITGDGISLTDAVGQMKVSATARFVPATQDAFYGDGTAEIRNLATSEVRVYVPIGVVFTPGATDNYQNVIAYELGMSPVAQPTSTAPPGATSAPTTPPSPTAMPLTATATPAGTSPPLPTEDATATPQPEATQPAEGTPSPAPTEAPPPPADSPEPPAPTPTPTKGALPLTGDESDELLSLVLQMAVAALIIAVGANVGRSRVKYY